MSLILAPTRSIVRPKPLLGTQIDRSHPLSRGLVGCWLMNEGRGTIFSDSCPLCNHGTGTGLDWTVDRLGLAPQFATASTDKITLTNAITSSQNDSTIVFWATLNSTKPKMLIGRASATTDQIYVYDGTRIRLYASGTASDWTADKSFNGVRRMYAFVGSNAGWTLYLDGRSQGWLSNNNPIASWSLIGYGNNNTAYTWNGTISSGATWSRALTPSEISSLYADPYQMFRRGNPVILGGTTSGGNNYTETINDGIGVADDRSETAAIVRALSEAVGMADTASRAAAMLRALTESMGIADSVIESTAANLVETINDAVGLTDAQSRLSIMVRALADSLGMADAATTLAVLLRTITDAQGITDGQTLARMISVADGLGVSDEMGRIVAYLRGRSDSVDLTDTMARLHAAVREITDTEGLTDSYSTAWTVLRTIADTLGLTDAMIQEGTGALVRVINDVLGIVDARTKLHAALRVLASTINTADSMSRLFAVTRVISDAEGITDGAYLGKVFTFAESIGISDEVSRLVAFLRTQEEGVGITDAIVRVATVLRTLDESIQLTDSEQHSLSGLVQAAMAFLLLKKSR